MASLRRPTIYVEREKEKEKVKKKEREKVGFGEWELYRENWGVFSPDLTEESLLLSERKLCGMPMLAADCWYTAVCRFGCVCKPIHTQSMVPTMIGAVAGP